MKKNRFDLFFLLLYHITHIDEFQSTSVEEITIIEPQEQHISRYNIKRALHERNILFKNDLDFNADKTNRTRSKSK